MSRQKGNAAEREVAKLIQPWWQKVEPEAEFVRTPLSGGWGGPSIRAGFGAAGDLMTTAKRFPFTIEVKRREGWTWVELLAGHKSPVWKWWHQSQEQADEMHKVPMLWLRQNREKSPGHSGWRIMMPRDYGRLIGIESHLGLGHRWASETWLGINHGTFEPTLYVADHLLSVDPFVFAEEMS